MKRSVLRTALYVCAGLLAGVLLAILTSCATLPDTGPPAAETVYVAADSEGILAKYAPVFVIGDSMQSHNLIGRPSAYKTWHGEEAVYIDSSKAVMYARRLEFSTDRDVYTNLVYRVHFERVPYSLFPFNISAGINGGLLVIVTVNSSGLPVLVTTVHTCGCYLAFFGTGFLPEDAWPEEWAGRRRQRVWGESLPLRIDFPQPFSPESRVVLSLRDDTHRVMDVSVRSYAELISGDGVLPLEIAPMEALYEIPVRGGGTTSFFESDGLRAGYVKGSYKPLETLLVSWWALDLYVGADKEFAPGEKTGNFFYTSLKPWNRRASDMWKFRDFLAFWGWGL